MMDILDLSRPHGDAGVLCCPPHDETRSRFDEFDTSACVHLAPGHGCRVLLSGPLGGVLEQDGVNTAPPTDERTTFTVRVGLIDNATGEQLHEYTFEPDVFPALAVNPNRRRLYLLKDPENSYGFDIAKELGIRVTTSGNILPTDTVLVDRYSAYQQRRDEIGAAVKAGARCVILEQPSDVSEMNVGGLDIRLQGGRTQRWIVMRNADHPWLKATRHNDFKFWYQESPDGPSMHCYRRFSAPDFTPVLTQRELPVIAERKDGAGHWIVAQFCFRDRVQSNPAGAVLLHTLLFGE